MAKQEAKDKLTPKQEKFVQNLIQGMSQAEAYRAAYSTKNMSDNAVNVEACRLLQNPKVALKYEELRGKLSERAEKKALMSAEERLEWLADVINGVIEEEYSVEVINTATGQREKKKGTEPSSLNIRLKALDIYNKMSGDYVTKLQGDVNIQPKLEDLL